MVKERKTKAAVLFWTPAPARTSTHSSSASDHAWEDEDEEQAGGEDDFFSQMDENGIIGLSEALEGVELEVTMAEAHRSPGCLSPEDAGPSGQEKDPPTEEISYNHSASSPSEDPLNPSSDRKDHVKALTLKEEERQRMMEELDVVKEKDEWTKREWKYEEQIYSSTSGKVDATNGLVEDQNSLKPSCSIGLPDVEPHGLALSWSASTLPHLLPFTAEELASAPGIDAETIPEISYSETLSESPRSHQKLKSFLPQRDTTLRDSPAALLEHSGASDCLRNRSEMSDKHHEQPVPSPRNTRTPETSRSKTLSLKSKYNNAGHGRKPIAQRGRSDAAEVVTSRNEKLNHPTLDFSKVDFRVHLPKEGYKPPKSRRTPRRDSMSPEAPLVYKSPADIIKEVLLNSSDGSSSPSTSATITTVPLEFRSRQDATTLLRVFQEDYDRLLTKYAEAENTIDRLRLEARVNLYSDPPKAGSCVQSGLNQDASKPIHLDFPQAQRVELNWASLSSLSLNGHSNHQGSPAVSPSTRSSAVQLLQELASILFSQAHKFLQQLQTFENLLRSGKLKPTEKIAGICGLAEGLDSLEKGYLLARDEHLQQQGADISHFDPDRELEGLVFQCGVRMDELKEQVGLMQGEEEQLSEASLSLPPQPLCSSTPSKQGGTVTHQQMHPVAVVDGSMEEATMKVGSVSRESDEEMLSSLSFRPLVGELIHPEEDSTMPGELFKEPPKLPQPKPRKKVPLSAILQTDLQPGDEEEQRRCQEDGNTEVWKTLPQNKVESDHPESPTGSSNQCRGRTPVCGASSQSAVSAGRSRSCRRRLEMRKSHSSSLSSLGDLTASERRSSKVQAGSRRPFSQDGIISPETDSGFIGSESSRLTPAAAPSRLHQRASQRTASVSQVRNSGRPTSGPVPATSASPSHRGSVQQHRATSRLSLQQPGRSRQKQRRRTLSTSPLSWAEHTQAYTESEAQRHSTASRSDSEHSEQYGELVDSPLSSSLSSSYPNESYRHGDPLRATRTSQMANCNDAIQTLQAEVSRLAERLDGGLKSQTPPRSVKASVQDNYSHPSSLSPNIRSAKQQSSAINGRRGSEDKDEEGEKEVEATLKQTASRSSSAHRQNLRHPNHLIQSRSGSSTPPSQTQKQPQPQLQPPFHLQTQFQLQLPPQFQHLPHPRPQFQPPPQFHFQPLPQSQLQLQPQPQPQLQPQSQPQLQPLSQFQPQPQPQFQPQLQPQSQFHPQSQFQPQLQPQSQPQSHLQPQSLPQSQLEPRPQPQSLMSRYTQTPSVPESCCSHTGNCSRKTVQPPVASVAADEPDSRGSRELLHSRRASSPVSHAGTSERPDGGIREPSHYSPHCRVCGRTDLNRSTQPGCHTHSVSTTCTSCQPDTSSDRASRGRSISAAPQPAVLQCLPVCPPHLLLYSSPIYMAPPNSPGGSSGVKVGVKTKRRTRRSLSVVKETSSLDSSLNRALRATRDMKHTSSHMVRCLAEGLHHHELLNQSCSY